jgi:hypothetical protein
MADKTSDAIKLNLRLPKPLHRRLKQQAKRNNVWLNTEIVNVLEGAEAATAKRMAEAMKPLVEDLIETAVVNVTGRLPHLQAEIMLDILLGRRSDSRDPLPTQAEVQRRLAQIKGLPVSTENQLVEIFLERQAAEAAAKKPEQK